MGASSLEAGEVVDVCIGVLPLSKVCSASSSSEESLTNIASLPQSPLYPHDRQNDHPPAPVPQEVAHHLVEALTQLPLAGLAASTELARMVLLQCPDQPSSEKTPGIENKGSHDRDAWR